jgi:hypothetical protein
MSPIRRSRHWLLRTLNSIAVKEGIVDGSLKEIVTNMENGSIDADLGGGVFK